MAKTQYQATLAIFLTEFLEELSYVKKGSTGASTFLEEETLEEALVSWLTQEEATIYEYKYIQEEIKTIGALEVFATKVSPSADEDVYEAWLRHETQISALRFSVI